LQTTQVVVATFDGRNAKKGSLSKVMCHTYTIPDSSEDTPQGQESGKQQKNKQAWSPTWKKLAKSWGNNVRKIISTGSKVGNI